MALNNILPIMWKVHASDKSLMPYLERAFLKSFEFTDEDLDLGEVQLHDRSKWTPVLDPKDQYAILHELEEFGSCYCVGSFQLFKDGAKIVLLRKDRIGSTSHE